ncbi:MULTISPECIES: carbamoyltransferase HypF [Corynebacterium]|uniref:carbamoyltransferase HypF n=1 Tax=Corynebacterium TaxID=1716 RepID=UPI00091C413B|nr:MULTISPECIES: carbamoyltransferase HypF [Corynebacterium]MDK7110439.1 carbamoyltransferase HypF [Corynebacterium amycolatum]MDK7144992.1 carbamoyltransferase HypF [Corynebacterium amycolatum]OHR36144.1 carbamoyltransferase HypF [Corynebacterium sp. HMSC074C03]
MEKAGTTGAGMGTGIQRIRWRIEGIVQGVGFRPFVATIARRAGLVGFCGNDEQGVFIEVEGTSDALAAFRRQLFTELPALARIINHSAEYIAALGREREFTIVRSRHSYSGRALLPPDTALCPDCRREFFDPTNPRYLYPFISCTNCGPRLSIITELPYDRPHTTMAAFPMCTPCEREYTDPTDRRYHAQPISCFDCGPHLSWHDAGGTTTATSREEVLALFRRAHALLDDGALLAVKGIGGFHLVCDAANDAACEKLRMRKRRPDKPLAVMAPTVDTAAQLVELTEQEKRFLDSPEAPIVIAPKQRSGPLSDLIAPGLDSFGIMLPYSGIHLLLCDRPLVVTSGNLSGEPVCTDNDDALKKLGHIADAFILHDREIHVPVEDSVFIGTAPSRRSRGFAPIPVSITATDSRRHTGTSTGTSARSTSQPTIFATGGELKNTFAIAHGDLVHVSAHIGDMGSWTSQKAYQRAVDQLLSMRDATPDFVVCDLHPDYATTAFAERFAAEHDIELLSVQHHFAHALSLLAEHRLLSPSAGHAAVATLDGTGYGTDGSIWGGEILTLSRSSANWERTWHCPSFPLVGGDRAVTHPWRLALGLAHEWELDDDRLLRNLSNEHEVALVKSQLATGIGTVQTSSLGRIFDAAAALLLPRWRGGAAISYEAQAAMELEAVATRYVRSHAEALGAISSETKPVPLQDVIREAAASPDAEQAAFLFHSGVAGIVGKRLVQAAEEAGTDVVGVSGGCANNALLMELLQREVTAEGFTLLQHQIVPPGDGGLSLGQAVAGRLLEATGMDV